MPVVSQHDARAVEASVPESVAVMRMILIGYWLSLATISWVTFIVYVACVSVK